MVVIPAYKTDRFMSGRKDGGKHIDTASVGIAVDRHSLFLDPLFGFLNILRSAVSEHFKAEVRVSADRAHGGCHCVPPCTPRSRYADRHSVFVDASADCYPYGSHLLPDWEFFAGPGHSQCYRPRISASQCRSYFFRKEIFERQHIRTPPNEYSVSSRPLPLILFQDLGSHRRLS